MINKTVSHYQITERLGQGGMGVVYKALDTNLDRAVALKFLPEYALSTDEDKVRFQREAKAAAQLNHPNICTIYEIDETEEGKAFIAMEYIAGETLAEKIQRGPLNLQEAITIASQVAEGLHAAHDQGIVHRDVKSANVMLTEKGPVKIMDFGLAKVETASMLTKEGTTMGTTAYMSPEQAQGKAVDHRSDIWALGVVLYEMVTGQVPFKGDYEQAIIYAILNQDPVPLTALRTGVPVALDGVIAKALAKDPALRYQHADEMPADLRAIDGHPSALATLSTTRRTVAPAKAPARRPVIPWIVAAVMAGAAVLALWSPWRVAPQAPISHLALLSEPSERFVNGGFAISPDGSRVVFTGRSDATSASSQLFLRSFDEHQATPLPGTELAESPFFSPDGQWIGFISGARMHVVSVSGGRPIPIYEGLAANASWGPGNQIIFTDSGLSGEGSGELMLVSALGGPPKPLLASEDDAQRWVFSPHFLPGGRAVLFMARSVLSPDIEGASIIVQSLDTNERRTLIRGGTNPHYVPTGHLIYGRAGTIMAVPFDLESLTLTGPAVIVIEGAFRDNYGEMDFSLSNTGTLLYRTANQGDETSRMVWVDRSGVAQVVATEPHVFWDPRLSPNGERIAIFSRTLGTEVWIYERTQGTLMRMTVNPGEDETVTWSPNGQWIAFASTRPDQPRAVFRTPSDGSGAEEILWTSDHHVHVESWSPDGQALILTEIDPQTREDLWVLHLEDDPVAQPLIQTAFREFGGRVSPDGRWLAYVSDESGRLEVYVQAYPDLGQKVPVSKGGGTQPVWGASGRTLYYRGEESVMEVTMTPGERFKVSSTEPLFMDRYVRGGNHTNYDVAGDGEQFLMIEGEDAENPWTSLSVVLNWLEDVKQRVPTGR